MRHLLRPPMPLGLAIFWVADFAFGQTARCSVPTPAEAFKDYAAGIQSLAVVVGVVVAGFWAVYVFRAQRTAQNAAAQLAKLTLEMQRSPKLVMEVNAEQIVAAGQLMPLVRVMVTIKNHGTKDTRIDWSLSPLTLAQVEPDSVALKRRGPFAATGMYSLEESGGLFESVGTGVPAGVEKRYHAIFSTYNPGTYLVTFRAAARAEHVTRVDSNKDSEAPIYWKPSSYVVVSPTPSTPASRVGSLDA